MTIEETHRAEICQAIVRELGLGLLFTSEGPSPEALALPENALTPYQELALRAAVGFWLGELSLGALEALGLARRSAGVRPLACGGLP